MCSKDHKVLIGTVIQGKIEETNWVCICMGVGKITKKCGCQEFIKTEKRMKLCKEN